MGHLRTVRLNSLLKEVLSEVIHKDIHHIPHINEFVTITRVEITNDLYYAKVFVSVLASDEVKNLAIQALQDHAKIIAHLSSKKVVMRHFPSLTFVLDIGLEKQLRIEELLSKLADERKNRPITDELSTPPNE